MPGISISMWIPAEKARSGQTVKDIYLLREDFQRYRDIADSLTVHLNQFARSFKRCHFNGTAFPFHDLLYFP